MRFAFKVFYIGSKYQGFQRQPNGQTIENFIEIAFIKSNLIHSFKENQYKGTSRTDQGVHAITNVFAINLETSPNLSIINTNLPNDIIIWAYTKVNSSFNPRKNVRKHYQYFIKKTDISDKKRLKLFHQYLGSNNYSSMIKKHGAGMNNAISVIKKITILDENEFFIICFIGNRFGREQIRKMVGLIVYDKYIEIQPRDLLVGKIKKEIKSADPHNLFLRDIIFEEKLNWKVSKRLEYKISKVFSIFDRNLTNTKLIKKISEDFTELFQGSEMS